METKKSTCMQLHHYTFQLAGFITDFLGKKSPSFDLQNESLYSFVDESMVLSWRDIADILWSISESLHVIHEHDLFMDIYMEEIY
jgi:hypothetical protein